MSVVVSKNKTKLLIRLAILFFLSLLITVAVIVPLRMKRGSLLREVEAMRERNSFAGEMVGALNPGEKLSEIMETLQAYQRQIPNKAYLTQILDDLVSEAQSLNITVTSIQPTTDTVFKLPLELTASSFGARIREVTIEIQGSGTYINVGKYLSRLEAAPYVILPKKVLLSKKRNVESLERRDPNLEMDLKINVLMKETFAV